MNKDFDAAIDFARDYRRDIAFCAKMLLAFEVTGSLTQRQIEALLRIRRETLGR